MIVEFLLVGILAKIKRYQLKYLFYSWTFYVILLIQCILIYFQFAVFFDVFYFIKFASLIEPAIILSFIFAIIEFKLYKPAIVGSVCVVVGSLLNKIVISQNGGKMPVFPSLSYITGYVNPDTVGALDELHVLGDSQTKLKFLTDYIDFGYSILSLGDIFIHLFVCIMFYYLIKAVNEKYSNKTKKGEVNTNG